MSSGGGMQPQDVALTLLGAYLRPRDAAIPAGALVHLLTELGFSVGAARVAVSRLSTRDLVARSRGSRGAEYRLTDRGRVLLDEGDRRIFSFGCVRRGDGPWTVLWHTIPPDRRVDRARLARRLRFLGFGSLQDRTWFAAHDRGPEVAALLEQLDLGGHCAVFVGRALAGVDLRAVVAQAWDLEDLGRRYDRFVEEFGGHLTTPPADDAHAFVVRTRLVHAYRAFPLADPELSSSIAPEPPARAAAVALFDRLYAALADGAQRHVDAVCALDKGTPREPVARRLTALRESTR